MHALLLPFLLALPSSPASEATVPAEVPWIEVDSTPARGWSRMQSIDVVAIDDSNLIGCYESTGSRNSSGGVCIVRSKDGGRTWARTQSLPDLRYPSMARDGDRIWLIGSMRGPVVLASSDADIGMFEDAVPLRGGDRLDGIRTSIVHDGRVWRPFRRTISFDCGQTNAQVLVGSAQLGTDLRDPAAWRWSGERAAECIGASRYGSPMRFVARGDGSLRLTVEGFGGVGLTGALDVAADGWTIELMRDATPTWKSLPASADRFEGDRCTSVDVASSRGDVTNVLTLAQSTDMETWQHIELLRDDRPEPIQFEGGTVRVVGADLLILFKYRTNLERDIHASPIGPAHLAFLRVPNFVKRTIADPPVWAVR